MTKKRIFFPVLYLLLPTIVVFLSLLTSSALDSFIYSPALPLMGLFIVPGALLYISLIIFFISRPCHTAFFLGGNILLSLIMFIFEAIYNDAWFKFLFSGIYAPYITGPVCLIAVIIMIAGSLMRRGKAKEFIRPKMHKYRAVVFDFDLTLADAVEGIILSTNHALASLGLPGREPAEIKPHIGKSLEKTYLDLTGDTDKENAEKFRISFTARADEVMTANTKMLPHAETLLHRLSEHGFKTGIVTNKNGYRIYEALDRFGLRRLVSSVVGFEHMKHPKPAPDGLVMAARELNVDRRQILYVGDSLIDLETAAAAGVDFLAVTTGHTTSEDFSANGCADVISSLAEF